MTIELPVLLWFALACLALVGGLYARLSHRHAKLKIALERVRGQRDAYAGQIGVKVTQQHLDVTTDRPGRRIDRIQA